MNKIISLSQSKNNTLISAESYAAGILLTNGKKTCTELARATSKSHDAVLRELNLISNNPEEVRSALISAATTANKKNPGYLIMDGTLLIKEHAKKIEGVSLQHSGSTVKPGIGLMATVWTDLKQVIAVDAFTWKRGDQSKIVTGAHNIISLSQKIGTLGVIADGAFASRYALKLYIESHVPCLMRFHANRVVDVAGFDQPMQLKNHPAFKMKKNKRFIIKRIKWHDIDLYVVAIKIKHPRKGWIRIFLVTTMNLKSARAIAKLYTHRWKIEVFIRINKQTFGLGDCLSRSLKKQEAHCLSVFLAYNIFYLKYKDKKKKTKNTYLPDQMAKMRRPYSLIPRVGQNFYAIA